MLRSLKQGGGKKVETYLKKKSQLTLANLRGEGAGKKGYQNRKGQRGILSHWTLLPHHRNDGGGGGGVQ